MDKRPIGVLDSGLGGLTAAGELMRAVPNEDLIYFGDTGRVPYGTRSRETIFKYTIQDIKFLLSFDIKLLVVACGTISSLVLSDVKKLFDIPMIGVVSPAAKNAAEATKSGRVGVIATPGTIACGAFERELLRISPSVKCSSVACPLFVPLVENGRFLRGDSVIETVAGEYLSSFDGEGIDTMILGCTHYPLLKPIISDILGEDVRLIDAGRAAADDTMKFLSSSDLENEKGHKGEHRFFVSDDPDGFSRRGAMFLNREIDGKVSKIDIDSY